MTIDLFSRGFGIDTDTALLDLRTRTDEWAYKTRLFSKNPKDVPLLYFITNARADRDGKPFEVFKEYRTNSDFYLIIIEFVSSIGVDFNRIHINAASSGNYMDSYYSNVLLPHWKVFGKGNLT